MGQGYRDLVAWQKAMGLVAEIYRVTARFLPTSPRATAESTLATICITSQLRTGP